MMMGRRKQSFCILVLLLSTLPLRSLALLGLTTGIDQRSGCLRCRRLPSPQFSPVDREAQPYGCLPRRSFTTCWSSSTRHQSTRVRMGAAASRRGGASDRSSNGSSRRQATRSSANRRVSASSKSPKAVSRRTAKDSGNLGVGASSPSSSSPGSVDGGDVRDAAAAARSRHQHRPPPWQVLSAKDAKKNVEREIHRRDLIRRGLKAPHEPMTGDEIGGLEGGEDEIATLSSSLLNDLDRQFLKWRPSYLSSSTTVGLRIVGSYLGNANKIPPLGVPEVAFLGRSNVGKSSLLNRLVANVAGTASETAVARVGKTPGATASVNLYALFDARRDRDVLGLCDLPGFGYAKLSKEVQESVQVAAERYLSKRRQLALGILLVDIRRAPSDDDRAVLAALYDLGVPILVVATKVDKVDSDRRRQSCLEAIRSGLGLPPNQPLAVSSATGDGCRHLWRIVLEACENAVDEFGSKYEGDSDRRSEGRSPAGEADERSSYNHDLLLPDDGDEIVYDQGYDWIDEE